MRSRNGKTEETEDFMCCSLRRLFLGRSPPAPPTRKGDCSHSQTVTQSHSFWDCRPPRQLVTRAHILHLKHPGPSSCLEGRATPEPIGQLLQDSLMQISHSQMVSHCFPKDPAKAVCLYCSQCSVPSSQGGSLPSRLLARASELLLPASVLDLWKWPVWVML